VVRVEGGSHPDEDDYVVGVEGGSYDCATV